MEIIQLVPSWVWVYGFLGILIMIAANIVLAVGYLLYLYVIKPRMGRSSILLETTELPDVPLSAACRTGDAKLVKTLLARGANPNDGDGTRGITPLMWAAKRGDTETVRVLLKAGADPLATGPLGTAVTLASQSGNLEVREILKPYYQEWTFQDRYGGFFSRITGKNYQKAREDYYSFMRGLVRRRVESPYSMGVHCALGDVFLESAMDAKAVHRVMEAYGIEDVSSVFDPTSNVTFETVMMHGRHAEIRDTFGQVISDPNNIPKLVPTSELAQVSGYLNSINQPADYWAGHAAERVIRDRLEGMGYEVMLPLSSNQEGYDLLVDKKFFDDHGLPFTQDSETGLGMLQVKNVTTEEAVARHLDRFADNPDGGIPVIAPDDVAENCPSELVMAFSDIGLDREEIVETVTSQLKDLASEHFADVAVGMDTSIFQDAVEGYGGLGFESGIPWLGPLVATSLQSYRSYQLFSKGRIDGITMFKEVTKAGGTALVVGTATKFAAGIATGVAVAALPGVDSASEAFAEGIDAAGDLIGGDFDLGDLADLGEFAIIAGVFVGTAWLVKKGFGSVSGFVKKKWHASMYTKLERTNQSHERALLNLRNNLSVSRDALLNACGSQIIGFQRERNQRIEEKFGNEQRNFDNKRTLPSLRYFFLEYAIEKQKRILAEMDRRLQGSPLYFFLDFFSDFEPDYTHNAIDKMIPHRIQQTYQAAVIVRALRGHDPIPSSLKTAATTLLDEAKELSGILKEFKEKKLPLPELR